MDKFINANSTEVSVRVGSRQEGGGQVEYNPFSLIISPSPAYSNANGAISIASALVSTAPTAGPLLVQYWTIAYDQATGATNATLTNPANELTFGYNLINVPSEIAPNIMITPSHLVYLVVCLIIKCIFM